MGIYYYWANDKRKEYIRPRPPYDDNLKYPVGPAAEMVFLLLRHGYWESARIYNDTGDMPFDDYVDGHDGWREVSDVYFIDVDDGYDVRHKEPTK